jgi:hypothetical protein
MFFGSQDISNNYIVHDPLITTQHASFKKKHNKTENLYGITSRHGIATPAEY